MSFAFLFFIFDDLHQKIQSFAFKMSYKWAFYLKKYRSYSRLKNIGALKKRKPEIPLAAKGEI